MRADMSVTWGTTMSAMALANVWPWPMRAESECNLGYDDVGHGLGQCMQLLGLVEAQYLDVVLEVVLDAVIDVRNLADVVDVRVRPEVLDQFAPAALHQLPRLTMVELYL